MDINSYHLAKRNNEVKKLKAQKKDFESLKKQEEEFLKQMEEDDD
jgi:hypothetical protein